MYKFKYGDSRECMYVSCFAIKRRILFVAIIRPSWYAKLDFFGENWSEIYNRSEKNIKSLPCHEYKNDFIVYAIIKYVIV